MIIFDTDTVLNLIAQTALDLIAEAAGCVIHFVAEDGQQLLPIYRLIGLR